MRRLVPLLLLIAAPGAAAAAPLVVQAEVEGPIHGITAEYVARAVERADEARADLLLVTIDTPGGMVSSTEEIIRKILQSRTPVAFFVSPRGAAATSAGFYLTISADVAAMALGTRIGAAHPVTPFGENKKEDIMMQKAENDLAAQARSLAQRRGRNVEIAEKMVRESISLTDSEALDRKLVDVVCHDVPDLLSQLEGRTIRRFDGTEVVLRLAGASIETFEMTRRQKILAVISDPTMAFILFVVGILGLYIEFTHPGLVAPGVVGGLALLLFAISTQILPVNLLGLLLIALGIVLFVLEVKVASYGLLTVGGILAVTFGFLVLFEGPVPELSLPLGTVLPTSLTLAGIMAFLTQRALRAQMWKVATGREGLRGELGTALTDVEKDGRVFVHGEYWNATAREKISAGEKVRVSTVRDMVIEVERAERS